MGNLGQINIIGKGSSKSEYFHARFKEEEHGSENHPFHLFNVPPQLIFKLMNENEN